MKNLLIGLTLLGSFSTFANENINILKAEFTESYKKISTGEVEVDYDVDDIHQCVVHGRENVHSFRVLGNFKTRLVAHRGGANLSCEQMGEVCTKRNRKDKCVKKELGTINICNQSLDGGGKDVIGNALSEYMLLDNGKNIYRSEATQSFDSYNALKDRSRYNTVRGKETVMIGIKTLLDNAMTFEISVKGLEAKTDLDYNVGNLSGYVSDITKAPILAYVKCYNTGVSLKDSNPSVKK